MFYFHFQVQGCFNAKSNTNRKPCSINQTNHQGGKSHITALTKQLMVNKLHFLNISIICKFWTHVIANYTVEAMEMLKIQERDKTIAS